MGVEDVGQLCAILRYGTVEFSLHHLHINRVLLLRSLEKLIRYCKQTGLRLADGDARLPPRVGLLHLGHRRSWPHVPRLAFLRSILPAHSHPALSLSQSERRTPARLASRFIRAFSRFVQRNVTLTLSCPRCSGGRPGLFFFAICGILRLTEC